MFRKRALISQSLAIALAAGLVAACGSSAKAAGTSKTHGSVTIGLLGSFSGALGSSTGAIPKVMNAWASTVNASGGLDGEQVQIVTMDTGVGSEPGLADATQLISQDHVAAIVDVDQTPDDSTWLPYAKAQGVPVIVAEGAYIGALGDSLAFPVVGAATDVVYALDSAAKSFGPNFGIGYCAESASCGTYAGLLKTVGSSLGLDVPVSQSASSSAPDYTAVCQSFKGRVESYFLAFGAATTEKISSTCYQQGVRIPQVLVSSNSAPFWKTSPAYWGSPVVDLSAPYFATDTPAERAYRNALAKYAPGVAGTNLDESEGMYVWASGQLLLAAAKNVKGTLTAASIIDGLYALKNETLGGLVQPLTFVRNQPTWLHCWFTWKPASGQFKVANNGQPTCGDPSVLNTITQRILKKAG